MALAIKHLYEFGSFSLDATERVLRRDGELVPLTPKVFSTLLLLIENQGRIVSKEEMMSALWPDAFVEETNLTFNITKLRKALGDDAHQCLYVETVPRRGYRFKAEVKEVSAERCLDAASEIRTSAFVEKRSSIRELSETEIDANVSVDARHEVSILREGTPTKLAYLANPANRKRRNLLIAAALAAAILLTAGAGVWKYSNSNRGRGELLSAFAREEPNALPVLRYEQLTFNGNAREAAISPDGEYIAHTNESNRLQSLWLRQLATSQNIQLIPPADADYQHLAFSRDGTHLYYIKAEGNGAHAIYRTSTFGGPPTKLINHVKSSFALSPDESRIAFVRRNVSDGEEILFIANADGTGEHELIRRRRPERISSPTWSPDGRTIVCVAGHAETSTPSISLIEIDHASSTERLLLRPDWFHIGRVEWLPDGRGLLMRVSMRLASADPQLWLMSYPEGQVRRLTSDLNDYLTFSLSADTSRVAAIQTKRSAHVWVSPNETGSDARQVTEGNGPFAWTSDGHVVYSSTIGGNRDIWIMRADGTEQRQLTVDPGYDAHPAVSPDNRHIVFYSDRTCTHHLWRMNLDGSDQVQLTDGYGEKNPTISPDSRWVFYNAADRQTLWRVSIEGGAPIRLTDDYASYPSVSPDGRLIAYFQFSPETNEHLVSVRALDDSQAVRRFRLAPGRWASSSLQWDANARAVIYAQESEGQVKLYRQSLDASPPQQIASFGAEDDFNFSWSPDGRQFAFTRVNWQHDAVLIRISE